MGFFDIFHKRKPASPEAQRRFLDKLLNKYFEGSRSKLQEEVFDLLEITKFNVSADQMLALVLRCVGSLELGSGWNQRVLDCLRVDSDGQISDVDLKWLMVYCDLNYIKSGNPELKALLLFELGGRQIGLPSPTGNVSDKYKF